MLPADRHPFGEHGHDCHVSDRRGRIGRVLLPVCHLYGASDDQGKPTSSGSEVTH